MLLCDAHLHASDCKFLPENDINKTYAGVSCAHSTEEWNVQAKLTAEHKFFFNAFGIHPQLPDMRNLTMLETLLQSKKIVAVGETGFDFFTESFRADRLRQEEAWSSSLELAFEYSVPIIIHNRKALDLMFAYSDRLRKLPSVIFHSFAFSSREAESLLRHGINAFFSFGKPILNNNKKSIDCIENLPLNRILMETDAPYQTLKGESATSPSEIELVYNKAIELRKVDRNLFEQAVSENFCSAYNISRESLTAS